MTEANRQLAIDVREHLEYLRELGVETMKVELADSPPLDHPVMVVTEEQVSHEKVERFIPDRPFFAKQPLPPPAKPNVPANASRLSLLESTRLSKLNSETPPLKSVLPQISKNEMPKPTVSPATNLFADRNSALPDTGETIEGIRTDIGDCRRCSLCEGRTKIAHSTGSFTADLMFVGEAPGADEDAQGAPFVGRAGQLLTKIIEAIGFKREEVFIGNINRCRPPMNRAPLPNETAECKPFLLREIAVVRPKVIVVLGNTAMKNLLDTKEGITKIRGIFQDYYGVKVMPTFHPAYLLRDPSKKREVWDDMKKVRDYLNENR